MCSAEGVHDGREQASAAGCNRPVFAGNLPRSAKPPTERLSPYCLKQC